MNRIVFSQTVALVIHCQLNSLVENLKSNQNLSVRLIGQNYDIGQNFGKILL